MRVKYIFYFILLNTLVLLNSHCSARFVNKTELKKLKEKYSGIYIFLKPVDIGNNQKAQKGDKVKLYFIPTSESIKVYAYPHIEPRESAVGNNILYLFEDDFPDGVWSYHLFEKQLNKIIKKVK